MGATAQTIWEVPAYLPYLQPPLTEIAIKAAEEHIRAKLPSEYIDILKQQNGGYIRFSLATMVHSLIAGIGPHYPSLVNFDWEEVKECVSFPLEGLIPFDGDGHWHLCLDYRESKLSPSVTYIDIECDRQAQIAHSFSAYLAMLRIEVKGEFVLEAVSDIQTILSKLSVVLGTDFHPPNIFDFGYPVYRTHLGNAVSPEWLWISPNEVPRGFVRANDERYMELKTLIPGVASRFPELPPHSYIFKVTDAMRNRVLDVCEKADLHLRPLKDYLNR